MSTRVCNYCHGEGHWKDQCLLLKPKVKPNLPLHAPAMLCFTVSDRSVCVASSVGSGEVPGNISVCVVRVRVRVHR